MPRHSIRHAKASILMRMPMEYIPCILMRNALCFPCNETGKTTSLTQVRILWERVHCLQGNTSQLLNGMSQQEILQEHSQSSEVRTDLLKTCCSYCGDFNECQDHVVPVAWNSGNRKIDGGPTVDCCNMCNNLAGDFVAESVLEKAAYLEAQYQRKFARALTGTTWTRAELDELSGNLKAYIGNKVFSKLLLSAKLKNLDRVINGYPPNPIRGVYKRKEVTAMTKAFQHEFTT